MGRASRKKAEHPTQGAAGTSTEAPAIHDDTLPGGPRWMHNLADEPIWVETKTQYQQELAKRGLKQADTARHNTDDRSPWATATRLKAGHRDPAVQNAEGAWVATPPPAQKPPAPTGLVDLHGRPAGGVAHVHLSNEEAQILRAYKKFLHKHGLREALLCNSCFERNSPDGCRAFVRPERILIQCRCAERTYEGL